MPEEIEQHFEDPFKPSVFQEFLAILDDFASAYLTREFLQSSIEKLATVQNAIFLSLTMLVALISYYFGVSQGSSRAFTVLQQKYLNMEIRRKKTVKSINLAGKVYKNCTTLFYLLIVSVISTFGYLAYFEQESLITFYEFGFNGLSLLIGILLIIFVFFARILARKIKESNKVKLGELSHSEEELSKDLMSNLGNDLTNLLKRALIVAQNKDEKNELQKLRADFENKKKELEKVVQQLKSKEFDLNAKSKEIQALQAALNDVQSKAQQAFGTITTESSMFFQLHEREIFNYKQALRCITTFEWCDGCSKRGSANLDVESENVNQEDLKLSDISGGHSPANLGKSSTEDTPKGEAMLHQGVQADKDKKGDESEIKTIKKSIPQEQEDVDEKCTNNCIQRYFEMASEVNRRFNEEKMQINKLRKTIGSKK